MCGIFGLIAKTGATPDVPTIRHYLQDLFRLSEPRGQEASGLAVIADGAAQIFKRGMAPSAMLKTRGYGEFMNAAFSSVGHHPDDGLAASVAAIGHCRLVTNGAEIIPGNNQPVMIDQTVGIHNGIVTNDSALWQSHPELQRRLETDSEILFRLIDSYVAQPGDLPKAIASTFGKILGSASVAFFRIDTPGLVLATNFGSVYYCHLEAAGLFFFASERFILQSFLDQNRRLLGNIGSNVRQLKAGQGGLVPFDSPEPALFSLETGSPLGTAHKAAELGQVQFIATDVSSRLVDVRRCTKCVLPATYPLIEFNGNGVCQHCREYRPPALEGRDALETVLAQHRSKDGSPDCIVAFSGGRDSSYGLHLIKTEFRMNPIAYSYDWGMVTDIARRNQARVVGKLGIEHILRAADIPTKRRYIRKNIQAWLKRPHLGMVPLFTAGDKFFYDIGRELRRELNIPLVIFCAGNPLERTDFKGGFAGIRESEHGQRLFAFSARNKINIALFYLGQYLLNPAYLNESLFDSLHAFRSSFLGRDDFLYLFHYLGWNEDVIDTTLKREYDWETISHTDNTWRIGDGYTAFINYIFYSVAGFSEFDAFRSNQIRQGVITRNEALELIAKDNRPHLETLYGFAQQIGINLEEVLSRIDAIKKLY